MTPAPAPLRALCWAAPALAAAGLLGLAAALAVDDSYWAGPLPHLRQAAGWAGLLAAGTGAPAGLAGGAWALVRRRWGLAALAGLGGLAAAALALGLGLVAALGPERAGPPCASLELDGERYGLWSQPLAVGYGPLPLRLYRLRGDRRFALPGCEAEVSVRRLTAANRCALEASADGRYLAVRSGGGYAQLLDRRAGRCAEPAEADDEAAWRARSARIAARLGR